MPSRSTQALSIGAVFSVALTHRDDAITDCMAIEDQTDWDRYDLEFEALVAFHREVRAEYDFQKANPEQVNWKREDDLKRQTHRYIGGTDEFVAKYVSTFSELAEVPFDAQVYLFRLLMEFVHDGPGQMAFQINACPWRIPPKVMEGRPWLQTITEVQ